MFSPSDVKLNRILDQLNTLAEIGKTPANGVTRPTFGEAHLTATHRVADWMEGAELQVRFDRWGNLFGRLPGSDRLPCVMSGSHLDSVVNGGNYDGVLGVLSALEAVRMTRERGVTPARPIEVVSFIDEEGSRFRGLFGSTLATHSMSDAEIEAVADAEGSRFVDVLRNVEFRYPIDRSVDLRQGVGYYLELHIEQGARLERAGIPIGLVTGIAGPRFWRVQLVGQADHAGASEYIDRRDALLAASEIITAVRELGVTRFAETARMTVGKLAVRPNVVNVVAGQVTMDIDTRTTSAEAQDAVETALKMMVKEICEHHNIGYTIEVNQGVPATPTPDSIRQAIANAAQQAGVAHKELISWAAHDAMVMARVCEAGMIFVPCKDGRSHCPEEYAHPDDIAAGVAVLANALVELASRS